MASGIETGDRMGKAEGERKRGEEEVTGRRGEGGRTTITEVWKREARRERQTDRQTERNRRTGGRR